MKQAPQASNPGEGRRRWRRLAAAAIAIAAAVATNATPDAVAAPENAGLEQASGHRTSPTIPRRTAEESRANAVKFRQKYGLPHDDAALAAAAANPAPESQPRYGVTLTPAEFAEQVARDGWADAKGPLMDALRQRKDEFAGVWVDHQNGGGFVVMALPTASPLSKAAVLAAAPAGAPVRFESAQFSTSALEAAFALATSAQVDATTTPPKPGNPLVELRETRGLHVLGTGLHITKNRLFIGVKGLSKERVPELEAAWDGYAARGALPARSIVHFWRFSGNEPHESRFESPVTMKGGLQIYDLNSHGCTSNMSAAGGVVLTAAHCFGPNTDIWHDHHNIGHGLAYDGYTQGSTADVQAINLRVPRMASRFMFSAFECTGPYTLPGDTCQQVDKATGVHSGVYAEYERVCTGGVNTYWIVCGNVQFTSYAPTYLPPKAWRGAITFNDQVVTDYEAQPGTSGGVVGLGSTVHGIHSGSVGPRDCLTCVESTQTNAIPPPATGTPETGWGIFSRMSNAQANMSRNIITTRTWLGITSAYVGGKCADVQNNLSTNGTPVWSWPCDGNAAQRWQLEPYGSSHVEPNVWWTIKRYDLTSKCMDIDTNADNGARVQEWDCNNSPQQVFRFDKYGDWQGGIHPSMFRILSMRTDKCVDLDISAGGQANGTKIQQYTCLGEAQRNQYWKTW